MTSDIQQSLAAILDRLLQLATEDAELRSRLRVLADAYLAATADSPDVSLNVSPDEKQPTTAEVTAADPVEASVLDSISNDSPALVQNVERVREPLPELTLGRSPPRAEPPRPLLSASDSSDTDLKLIEDRCRMKAEGARWVAKRRRLLAEGANYPSAIEPTDQEIIVRAKQIEGCFLWMCHPTGPSPANLALFDEVGTCFDTLVEALSLVRQVQEEPEANSKEFQSAIELLAEAQSALRVAIESIDGPNDTDQIEVFHWLKATSARIPIFIQRYMRLDDPADPSLWPQLRSRIADAQTQFQDSKRVRSQRKKLLGKVQHKATLILNDPTGAAEQWELLIKNVCELVGTGTPPSHPKLRDALIPIIELLPDQLEPPPEFKLVLREIDRFLAVSPPPVAPTIQKSNPEVLEVAKLLNGRSLILIGGDKRQAAYQAIKDAFQLQELIWIETRPHKSIENFEPYVARPDVAVVVLAIRWSSHAYGDVKLFCETHGKPLVRLPSGYNSNQLAAQIMSQCSERLRETVVG